MPHKRTIAREISFSGRALQTGRMVSVVCSPASAGEGIVFRRTDISSGGEVSLGYLSLANGPGRRTTIAAGRVRVQTVEHFLAALWCVGIDSLKVRMDGGELPALDGSPLGFIKCLKSAGTTELEEERSPIKISEPLRVEESGRSVEIIPYDKFAVSYLIDYKTGCVGRQKFEVELDPDTFEREIAPARTFCTLREALFLRILGFGLGANLNNTLVLTGKGPLKTSFRFPDEPVRHKVADLVGDLYMLGRPVIGKVLAERSGHRLNGMLVRKIYEKYTAALRKGDQK